MIILYNFEKLIAKVFYLTLGNPKIIHRDIKSANILLDNAYEAQVCIHFVLVMCYGEIYFSI